MWFSCERWLLASGLLLSLCSSSMAVPTSTSDSKSPSPPKQKVLLILLDGFRWNYPMRSGSPSAFIRIRDKGVIAQYLEPVFPTMSFPNYHSLVTGMYPENHGIVMNNMYDEPTNTFFDMLPSNVSAQPFWWNQSEPIWISAAKANLRISLYDWPGCEVIFNATLKPKYTCEPYEFHDKLDSFYDHVTDAIGKFGEDEIDLAQIYVEYADYIGHKYGPESTRMTMAIHDINEGINDLMDMLQDYTMEKKVTSSTVLKKSKLKKKKTTTYVDKVKVNVIIVSDHGMTSTDDQHVKRISLDTVLNLNDIRFILGQGASVSVYPQPDKIDQVYNALRAMDGINVWKKQDIPEKYHLKNNARTPPIFVLAKKGYFIESIKNSDKQFPRAKSEDSGKYKGYHGYDEGEVHDMAGIFYAFGSGFEHNKTMPSINTVDVYNIMAHLLNIKRQPNNGSWTKVSKYLSKGAATASNYPMSSIIATCVAFYVFVQAKWLP